MDTECGNAKETKGRYRVVVSSAKFALVCWGKLIELVVVRSMMSNWETVGYLGSKGFRTLVFLAEWRSNFGAMPHITMQQPQPPFSLGLSSGAS